MDHNQKLAFIANMTKEALNHISSSPNIQTPSGGMSHDKMLSFVAAQTKHGLQHFDAGGTALSGPTNNTSTGQTTTGGVLGAVGNVLGTNNQFQAQGTAIQNGTNVNQLNQAYQGAQGAIGQQQGITNTLNSGLNQGANSQAALTNMYTQEANGQGPNPAQAQLNQTTGQNIAQQAALDAGQRGSGASAGLIAAQNAQQGAATQQAAVGQAATLGAQQQLAAQTNLQNLAANQVSQGSAATQGLSNAQQNEQNILQGANTSANNSNVAMQSNINNVNAGISQGNQSNNNNVLSAIGNGLSSAVSFLGFSQGGMIKMDKGGNVLDANARAHIAPDNFALPGGRYPIHDIAHARNALARVSQNGTPEEKKKVKAAVKKKYPSIDNPKKMDEGGPVEEPNALGITPSAANANDQGFQKDFDNSPLVKGAKAIGNYFSSNTPAPNNNMAKGGKVKMPWYVGIEKMAAGGLTSQTTSGPQSYVGNWLNSNTSSSGPMNMGPSNMNTSIADNGLAAAGTNLGETLGDALTPNAAQNTEGAANAGDLQGTAAQSYGGEALAYDGGLMRKGGKVNAKDSSQKAVESGDSLKNDKIPAMLSEGELVIDRETMKDPGPLGQMARTLAHHISKRNKK